MTETGNFTEFSLEIRSKADVGVSLFLDVARDVTDFRSAGRSLPRTEPLLLNSLSDDLGLNLRTAERPGPDDLREPIGSEDVPLSALWTIRRTLKVILNWELKNWLQSWGLHFLQTEKNFLQPPVSEVEIKCFLIIRNRIHSRACAC